MIRERRERRENLRGRGRCHSTNPGRGVGCFGRGSPRIEDWLAEWDAERQVKFIDATGGAHTNGVRDLWFAAGVWRDRAGEGSGPQGRVDEEIWADDESVRADDDVLRRGAVDGLAELMAGMLWGDPLTGCRSSG